MTPGMNASIALAPANEESVESRAAVGEQHRGDVLFVLACLAVGGSERKIARMANRLKNDGMAVSLTCLNGLYTLESGLRRDLPGQRGARDHVAGLFCGRGSVCVGHHGSPVGAGAACRGSSGWRPWDGATQAGCELLTHPGTGRRWTGFCGPAGHLRTKECKFADALFV